MEGYQFQVWVFVSEHRRQSDQQPLHGTPAPSEVAKWQLLQSTLKKPIYFALIKHTGKKRIHTREVNNCKIPHLSSPHSRTDQPKSSSAIVCLTSVKNWNAIIIHVHHLSSCLTRSFPCSE